MNMNCYPTTSGISHLLVGVFLGVSLPTRIQKLNKLPVLSASFRFRPWDLVDVKLSAYRSSESRSGAIKSEIAQGGHHSNELWINPPERFRILSADHCMCRATAENSSAPRSP